MLGAWLVAVTPAMACTPPLGVIVIDTPAAAAAPYPGRRLKAFRDAPSATGFAAIDRAVRRGQARWCDWDSWRRLFDRAWSAAGTAAPWQLAAWRRAPLALGPSGDACNAANSRDYSVEVLLWESDDPVALRTAIGIVEGSLAPIEIGKLEPNARDDGAWDVVIGHTIVGAIIAATLGDDRRAARLKRSVVRALQRSRGETFGYQPALSLADCALWRSIPVRDRFGLYAVGEC